MATPLNIRHTPDPKVKIYVETADEIFRLCVAKSKPDKSGSVYQGLANDMQDELDNKYVFNGTIDAKYLTNISSRIEVGKRNSEIYIGFLKSYIVRLALFAGIDDYEAFDEKFAPGALIRVLFRRSPFKFFDLVRVPDAGFLAERPASWEYTGDADEKIAGNVKEVSPFIMPGDREALWIQIKYDSPNGEDAVYFAADNQIIRPVDRSGHLFRFFTKKLISV